MSRNPARVSEGALYAPNLLDGSIELDSAAWFSWLEQAATRSFSYPLFDARCGYIIGCMTVRKEARERGEWCWEEAVTNTAASAGAPSGRTTLIVGVGQFSPAIWVKSKSALTTIDLCG